MRTEIRELYEKVGQIDGMKVSVAGWLRTVRDSKAFGFLEVNDGSCFRSVQVVVEADILENYKTIVKLNVGSSVRVTGTIVETPTMKQPFEIKAESVEIEGPSTSTDSALISKGCFIVGVSTIVPVTLTEEPTLSLTIVL